MTSMISMMTDTLEDTKMKVNEKLVKEHDRQERWPEKRMMQVIWMIGEIQAAIDNDHGADRISYLTDKALECARRHHKEMVEDMEDRAAYAKTGKYDGYEGVSQ